MSEQVSSWGFGDLRAYFHCIDHAPSQERFNSLLEHVIEHGRTHRDEVIEVWLPYILENLEVWPVHTRQIEGLLEDILPRQACEDAFYISTIYELIRAIYIECHKDPHADDLAALARQPYAAGITCLDVSWFGGDPCVEDLAHLFGDDDVKWDLHELSMGCGDFSDAHAEVLARSACLSNLKSLEFVGHSMTRAGIHTLTQSPHLKGLRRFLIGEGPECLRLRDAKGRITRFTASECFAFTESLPHLEALIGTHKLLALDAPVEDVKDHQSSVRDRIFSILRAYKDLEYDGNPFENPFDDESTFGRAYELSQAQWDDPGLKLVDVFPDAPTDYSLAYVVTTREGALQESFNESGELIAPLGFRMFGQQFDSPPGRDGETYQGQALFQNHCAEVGLATQEDEAGIIWLNPDDYARRSDLIVLHEAVQAAERRGVTYSIWACHPWGDVVWQIEDPYCITGLIEWVECDHRFNTRGDLTAEQPHSLIALGDMLCLRDELARRGLRLSAGTQCTYLLSRATP